VCFIYTLLVRINEHANQLPWHDNVTNQITYAAAGELAPLFARKLITNSKRPRSFTFSQLHAVMLKVILRFFGKHGQAIDEVMAMMVLSKLDPLILIY
jgi:hypothetical protein